MRPRALMLLFALATPNASPAQAGPWLPAPGDYYSEMTAGRYSARTYFDRIPLLVPLAGFGKREPVGPRARGHGVQAIQYLRRREWRDPLLAGRIRDAGRRVRAAGQVGRPFPPGLRTLSGPGRRRSRLRA